MGEMARALRQLQGGFPTCIQQVNYPIHQGKPNDAHGKFLFVGSIPRACYDEERKGSRLYNTEQEAIDAAITAGATKIQGIDCRWITR